VPANVALNSFPGMLPDFYRRESIRGRRFRKRRGK